MSLKSPAGRGCSRIVYVFLCAFFTISGNAKAGITSAEKELIITKGNTLYEKLHLSACGLKQEVFQKALIGHSELKKQNSLANSNLLSIVDLSQSSNAKRLYIIDLEKGELLYNTWVAHGRNSGNEFANSFSNTPNSFKSSIGFYVTGKTYTGKHGLSLQLKGCERGINDCAEKRAIVIHGASYVSESFIKQNGRLGRSQGCPAVSEELSAPIIQLVKEGSCLFMYYPQSSYLKQSALLAD